MFRPLLAAAIVLVIMGTVYAYTRFLDQLHARAQSEAAARSAIVEDLSRDHFVLRVTLSFAAEPDAFTGEGSLLVHRTGGTGEMVLQRDESIAPGEPLVVEPLTGVREGENIFYVQANPAVDHADRPNAVRVEILQGDEPLADASLWAPPGARVEGAVVIRVEKGAAASEPHEVHDHP